MWQKCPVCNGTGGGFSNPITNETFPKCTVCKGEKIISQATGLPPNGDKQLESKEELINRLKEHWNLCQIEIVTDFRK